MPQTESIVSSNQTAHVNGGSSLHDLFALSDEQILEIEPETQDREVGGTVQEGALVAAPAATYA